MKTMNMNKSIVAILILMVIFTVSCKKEADDSSIINLTSKPWKLDKAIQYSYRNNDLYEVATWDEYEYFNFTPDKEVEYRYGSETNPTVVKGNWWFSDNDSTLNSDIKITFSYTVAILGNAPIIKLTKDSLVVQTAVLNAYSSSNNDEYKHVEYRYYTH